MSHNIGVVLLKAARTLWCALVVIIPLAAFPWTTDHFEPNKTFAFVVIGAAIALCTVLGMVLTKSIHVKLHPVMLLPLPFLFFVGLSSIFSLDQPTSFLGVNGSQYSSFLFGLFLYVMLFLGSIFFEDAEGRRSVLRFLLIGSAIVGGLSLLTFFGVSLPPFQNTIGIPSVFAVYLLSSTFVGLGLLLADRSAGLRAGQTIERIAVGVTTLSLVATLIALDAPFLWVLTIISSLCLLVMVFARAELMRKVSILAVPVCLFLLSVLFLFVQSPQTIKEITIPHGKFPAEVSLSPKASLAVASATFAEHPFLGSGPGTFELAYLAHTPVDINTSLFWDTRFSAAMSEFLTMLATHGLLGLLALMLFPLALLIFAGKTFVSSRYEEMLPAFLGFLVLSLSFFFSTSGAVTVIFLMVFSALLAAVVLPPTRDVSHAHSPRVALISSFAALLGGSVVLVTLFLSLLSYSAEVTFAQAVARDREGGESMDVITLLNAAATRNSLSDKYFRNLANALLIQSSTVAKDPEVEPQVIQGYLAATVNAALAATKVGPNDPANYQMLCTVYREVSSVVDGANDHAITACEKAASLAPVNPRYLVDEARVYLVRADLLNPLVSGKDAAVAKKAKEAQADALGKAGDALAKAIALKNDYASARYYSGFVEERKGNLSGAIANMEVARQLNQKDVGVSIQLSLLYLRQGKNDLAEKELRRALTLAPENQNLLWYLAVSLAAKNPDEAVEILTGLQKTNPDNAMVKSLLETLQKKETPPPVEELPEPLTP